ncbi:Hpt domain-containing protein, partial [Paraburkholderia sp. Ac-20347]|uniref:Hpt domain-containing protein n=1 Tax=Paraburkholderia sp. Ac-20347 TaxID=2703892 RepID=UPI00197E1180
MSSHNGDHDDNDSADDLSRRSLLDLFHEEAQTQTRTLSAGLLALEAAPTEASTLEACMRATHSLKGAARIVGLPEAVEVASAMEDCFVAAQHGVLTIGAAHIDALLVGIDMLLAAGDPAAPPLARDAVEAFVTRLVGAAQVQPETRASVQAQTPNDAEALLAASIAALQSSQPPHADEQPAAPPTPTPTPTP